MSYKQCIFGVPVESEVRDDLLSRVASSIQGLGGDIDLPDVYVLINGEEDAKKRGLWLFMVGRTVAKSTRVDRGYFVDCMTSKHPLVTLLHDDQNGINLFRYENPDQDPSYTWLMNDGPYLGGKMAHFTVDYPQKGYSRLELDALRAKGFDDLSVREQVALTEYDNAITIGLRQFFPKLGYASYLDLLYLPLVHHIYSPTMSLPKPKTLKRPSDWHNMMAHWPEDSDWRLAKLPPRSMY